MAAAQYEKASLSTDGPNPPAIPPARPLFSFRLHASLESARRCPGTLTEKIFNPFACHTVPLRSSGKSKPQMIVIIHLPDIGTTTAPRGKPKDASALASLCARYAQCGPGNFATVGAVADIHFEQGLNQPGQKFCRNVRQKHDSTSDDL